MNKLLVFLSFALLACAEKPESSVYVRNTPVLALKELNEIADVHVSSADSSAFSISKVEVCIGSDNGLEELTRLCVMFDGREIASEDLRLKGRKAEISLPCALCSDGSELSFSIGLKTADVVDLDNKLSIDAVRLKTSSGRIRPAISGAAVLRMGVALRQSGQDGVFISRIPGLAITPAGTIIAIYDARYALERDLQADIDICCNRSTDGGRSWSDMSVVMDMGEWGGLPQKYNGVSDPCILVDDNSGDVYVSACWMHGVNDPETGKWVEGLTEESEVWNHQWRHNATHPGYDVRQSSQWLMAKSTDDGLTWSEPQNLTSQVKPEDFCLMINAPGAGITLDDGTLVFPAQGKRADESNFSTLICSRDGGNSWSAGNPAISDHSIHSNECMAAQLGDGSIMLNMRSNKNRKNHDENGRLVCVTKDLGQTWEEHPTSGHVLTEPTCQGSLLKHLYTDAEGVEHELLLFHNPADPDSRVHFTLKCSLDEGMSWPEEMWLELDEFWGYGYSCMISIDNDTIGIVYEGSGACLVFQRIKISDIVKF